VNPDAIGIALLVAVALAVALGVALGWAASRIEPDTESLVGQILSLIHISEPTRPY